MSLPLRTAPVLDAHVWPTRGVRVAIGHRLVRLRHRSTVTVSADTSAPRSRCGSRSPQRPATVPSTALSNAPANVPDQLFALVADELALPAPSVPCFRLSLAFGQRRDRAKVSVTTRGSFRPSRRRHVARRRRRRRKRHASDATRRAERLGDDRGCRPRARWAPRRETPAVRARSKRDIAKFQPGREAGNVRLDEIRLR